MNASLSAQPDSALATRSENRDAKRWIERQLRKVDDSLVAMNRGLGDNAYCSGIHLTLSDIAVGCALGYLNFRFPQIDWASRHPNLERLHAKLMQRSSFIDTQPA